MILPAICNSAQINRGASKVAQAGMRTAFGPRETAAL